MKNLKEILKNGGLVFVDNGDWEYDRFKIMLDENDDVIYVNLEEEEFELNVGKKDIVGFIERGIEEGILELDEESNYIYFDLDDEEVYKFILE